MMEHINYPIVAKTHPPMYSMHKFWARKPHNVVAKYILRYSHEGDIVGDPFCGSGVTAMEALKCRRKAAVVDLDPIATFITRCSIIPVDLEELTKAYKKIVRETKRKFGYFYRTRCSKCGQRAKLIGVAWNNGKPFEKVFDCSKCGRIRNKINEQDIELINHTEEAEINQWYPKNKLPPMKKEKLDYVYELFTKRNLIILSSLLSEIDTMEKSNTKEIMKLIFTSSLAQTTKMMPYVHESIGKVCKGWVQHSYWVPPKHWELNVFEYFRLGHRKITRAKENTNEFFEDLKEAKKFEDLLGGADYYIKTGSALELTNRKFPHKSIIPPSSIDYVFTDPPYGGSIQYLELSAMWASWLKIPIDFDEEITINRYQNKDFQRYDRMLKQAFREIYRILKPNKYLTVTFHNTQIRIRNSLIRSVVFAGYDMEKIVYQPPAMISAKAQLQPYGSAIGDYYIRFKKPTQEKLKTESEINEIRYERVVVDTVKRILAERGEPTSYSYLINFVDVELERNGLLLGAKTDLKHVLKKYEGSEFVLVDVQDGFVKGKKWWFKDPTKISFLDRIPLSERIEKAVIDVLESRDKASFDDVLQTIFIKFPNSLTPETQSIRSYLESYAIKTKDGRWRLNPDFKKVKKLHQTIINYLAEIGSKLGYKVWIAHKDEKISGIIESELSLAIDRLERVKEIDVLWFRERIEYEFEVENTTQITEAIVRGSNIPYNVKRIIVIPKKRERLFEAKFREPLLKERIQEDGWKIITYDELVDFYERNIKKKKIKIKELNELARAPVERIEEQTTLKDFIIN